LHGSPRANRNTAWMAEKYNLKKSLLLTAVVATVLSGCTQNSSKQMNTTKTNEGISTVYLTRDISPESLVKIYKALGVEAKGRVAVKMSTGEGSNPNYLKPELIKNLRRQRPCLMRQRREESLPQSQRHQWLLHLRPRSASRQGCSGSTKGQSQSGEMAEGIEGCRDILTAGLQKDCISKS